MLRGALLLACLGLLAICVASAEARRPATPAEEQAMAEGGGFPVECTIAYVSTVDQDYGTTSSTNRSGCPQGDGVVALERLGGFWDEVAELSEGDTADCPAKVPTAAARDLRLCHVPKTYILCEARHPSSDYSRSLRSKPRSCSTVGPKDSLAEAANLARLKWRGWGHKVARATGIEKGFHLPYEHLRTRAKAYRRRRCPDGDFIYTRLKTRTKYGSGVIRFPASCSD